MTTAFLLRADRPATPSDDLAMWSAHASDALDGDVLSAEMIAFCTSGVSAVIGVQATNGRPVAGMAIAARTGGAGVLRLMLRRPANAELLAAIEQGSAMAATFSRPRNHSSVQLKGRADPAAPADAADLAALATQAALFRDVLFSLGYTPAFAALYAAYQPHEIVTVALMPDRAFVQTPGPGAGSEIRP